MSDENPANKNENVASLAKIVFILNLLIGIVLMYLHLFTIYFGRMLKFVVPNVLNKKLFVTTGP